MSGRVLRAGVSGCGGISSIALDAGQRSPHFDVVAVQDPNAGRLEHLGGRYDISRRHLMFEDLLAEDLDFVILNGPNDVHLPQVESAAAKGVHCAVQKPMAPSLEAAEAMVRAADAGGVRLGVVMLELGMPLHHQVKQMLRDGFFGQPTLVQAVSAHGIYLREPPPAEDWRRDASRVGGGAFIQLAVHAVDLAQWLLGERVEGVFATTSRGRTVFQDETTLATTRFAGGVLGHFAASYAADLYGFQLCGTRGRIHMTQRHIVVSGEEAYEGEVFAYDRPGEEAVIPIASLEAALAARSGDLEIHHAFAGWLLGLGGYPCPAERGLEDMRVVDGAYRSVEEGRWVELY